MTPPDDFACSRAHARRKRGFATKLWDISKKDVLSRIDRLMTDRADVDVVVHSQADLVFVLRRSRSVLVGAAIADNVVTVIVLFDHCRTRDREFLSARLAQTESGEVAALER